MKSATDTATSTKQIHLTRRSPQYWRITLDHPPLNIFGPTTIPQLNEVITAIETDEHVKVVVFDSAGSSGRTISKYALDRPDRSEHRQIHACAGFISGTNH